MNSDCDKIREQIADHVTGILADEYVFDRWMSGAESFISDGLVPLAIWLVVLSVFYLILRRK